MTLGVDVFLYFLRFSKLEIVAIEFQQEIVLENRVIGPKIFIQSDDEYLPLLNVLSRIHNTWVMFLHLRIFYLWEW